MPRYRHYVSFVVDFKSDPWHRRMFTENPKVAILEHLRYAGLLSVQRVGSYHLPEKVKIELPSFDEETTFAITMSCPSWARPSVWQQQQVDRIQSFGTKAVAWKE